MATLNLNQWQVYLNLLHDLAKVENELRSYAAQYPADSPEGAVAHAVLYTEFGVLM